MDKIDKAIIVDKSVHELFLYTNNAITVSLNIIKGKSDFIWNSLKNKYERNIFFCTNLL